MRLVVVGGSSASTPELFDALAAWPGGASRRPSLDVVLQGRSADQLALVAAECRRRAVDVAGLTVATAVDLEAALDDADIVLVQARIGGVDGRLFDETFPRDLGLPGEETMGPGGLANAVRTVPALARVWAAILSRAPLAHVINLTNPAGIVTSVAASVGLRVVSVCDSPVTFSAAIASALGRPPDEIRAGYVGMNHAGFWAGGPAEEGLAAIEASPGIDPDDVVALGALPASYLAYYLHPERLLAEQIGTEPRAVRLRRLQAELLAEFAGDRHAAEHAEAGRRALRRGAGWYGLSVVPLIDAIANGADAPLITGLPNRARVPWADDDATIEGPVRVGRGAIFEPQVPVALPAAAAALLERHATYESLTVAALRATPGRSPRRAELVRALAANPMVPSAATAERLVDRILATSP